MPRIRYITKKFNPEHRAIITQANAFIAQYQAQGYTLSLRQLYYRFIATDRFPDTWIDPEYNAKNGLDPATKNTKKSYDKLGNIISMGRRAGLIDWDAIEDRGRNLAEHASWVNPSDIVDQDSRVFTVDYWEGQSYRVELFVEKDALLGVIAAACDPYQVPYISCRGYISDSEVWAAAGRLAKYDQNNGQIPLVLHMGDHDPSGIDATRDLEARLTLFTSNLHLSNKIEIRRLALNMNQVEQYEPPPNPAKMSDARFKSYEEQFGESSWELDALEPSVMAQLIVDVMDEIIDREAWTERQEARDTGREQLARVAARWDTIVEALDDLDDDEAIDEEEE